MSIVYRVVMRSIGFRASAFARRAVDRHSRIDRQMDDIRVAIGHLEVRLLRQLEGPRSLREVEFKVFSQWGEDGIIQYLIRAVETPGTTFVEIGVGDYRESNTRFLAVNDNWRGLIIDSGTAHKDFLRGGETGWRYGIDAVSSFVTRDNVNDVIGAAGIGGDVGLLSIDVDGVDYWLWEAIDRIEPRIVIVEFNSILGPDLQVTVPYEATFAAQAAHYSGQYFGASLAALVSLGSCKGYQLVGVGSSGVNAFFVRRDVAGALPDLSAAEAYVPIRARTSRSHRGELTFVNDHRDMLRLIRNKQLMRIDSGKLESVADLYGV